jgi:hypothetical protein
MTLTSKGKAAFKKLDLLGKFAPNLAFRILNELGEDGLKESNALAPKDTASLVSTGRIEKNKLKLIVTILYGGIMAKFSRAGKPRKFVNYAHFVENGTSRQPGRFFLTRGVNRAITKKNSIARKAFDNWIKPFK